MIVNADSRIVLADMAARGETVDSIVTDPPYGLVSVVKRFGKDGSAPAKSDGPTGVYRRASTGFMGQAWDGTGIEQDPSFWRLCLDVLKPGGHLLAFAGTRTWHRIAVAIDDAGFEIRDSLMWLYGTGFPKSHDVAVSIDKAARGVPHGGADPTSPNHGKYRTQATEGRRSENDAGQGFGAGPGAFMRESGNKNARCLREEAAPWQGWGTALKPAFEPIIVARKPLVGTVAQNVLRHGTGALNIDACRVPIDPEADATQLRTMNRSKRENDTSGQAWGLSKGASDTPTVVRDDGRWPANVLTDGTLPGDQWRFFYTAKASKRDRNTDWQGNPVPLNLHPTVKPTDLMRWLVTLVTPPGGTVLDPFAGSGSTGKAARAAGFRFIGIEADPKFADLAWMRYGGSDFEAKMARLRWAIRANQEARNGAI